MAVTRGTAHLADHHYYAPGAIEIRPREDHRYSTGPLPDGDYIATLYHLGVVRHRTGYAGPYAAARDAALAFYDWNGNGRRLA